MNPERPIDESFATLRAVQESLEQIGYYFYPVAKEHTEAGVTDPLVHRIRTQVKKRGFEKLAGKVAVAFSGYAHDEREIFAIPEIRVYWRKLDRDLPELPALVAYLPELGFNGPGIHLMMVGTVDEAIHRPELGGYDVSVVDAPAVLDDALRRIQQASATYRLRQRTTTQLIAQFLAGATHQIRRP